MAANAPVVICLQFVMFIAPKGHSRMKLNGKRNAAFYRKSESTADGLGHPVAKLKMDLNVDHRKVTLDGKPQN